ncbi:uncharacterized protein C3orf85 homolog [Ctenodactylus gundi]
MAFRLLQIVLCSTLLIGALGAPFFWEEPANQFLRLKRHVVYLQDYWDPDPSPKGWGVTVADQVREIWTSLKTTASRYLDMRTLDMSAAQ